LKLTTPFQDSLPVKATHWEATVLPDGRWLLYHADKGIAQTLTAPAGILWELCDGQTTIEDMLSQLAKFYPDMPYSVLAEETTQMLQEFLDGELIVCDESA
jgi:hypothetical protein